jgi:uncharacterized protein (AIM24 family)
MEDINIIEAHETDDAKVEILEYNKLVGSSDARAAERLFFVQQAGMTLKTVRITLNDSKVRIEPGALYYMEGNLEMKASTGGGFLKGLTRKALSGETFFVSEVHGTGVIYLEPTFGHFMLVPVDGEEYIVDKSLFYAGTAGLDISAAAQKNVSSTVFGGEGLFQTKIKGSGTAIIYSPVPRAEIQEFSLDGSRLAVDGNFALMRTGGVTFRAEKSSKSWVATSVSGEGLLQTFSGSGRVWIAPTQGVYEKLSTERGLIELAGPPGAISTMVDEENPRKA